MNGSLPGVTIGATHHENIYSCTICTSGSFRAFPLARWRSRVPAAIRIFKRSNLPVRRHDGLSIEPHREVRPRHREKLIRAHLGG